VSLRRRTPGERIAYLQGQLSALRMAVVMRGIGTKTKTQLDALAHLTAQQLEVELEAPTKPNCPYSSHADDCDCNGMGGDR
jgi:hypothetical protein